MNGIFIPFTILTQNGLGSLRNALRDVWELRSHLQAETPLSKMAPKIKLVSADESVCGTVSQGFPPALTFSCCAVNPRFIKTIRRLALAFGAVVGASLGYYDALDFGSASQAGFAGALVGAVFLLVAALAAVGVHIIRDGRAAAFDRFG